jgi:hypothetical protein
MAYHIRPDQTLQSTTVATTTWPLDAPASATEPRTWQVDHEACFEGWKKLGTDCGVEFELLHIGHGLSFI